MKAYLTENKDKFIDFPLVVDEISFADFSDMRAAHNTFINASEIKKTQRLEAKHGKVYLDNLNQEDRDKLLQLTEEDILEDLNSSYDALVEFIEVVVSGNIEAIPYTINTDKIAVLFKNKFCYDFENCFTEDLTLMRLYVHLQNICQEYQPKKLKNEFSFEWAGHTYHIDPREAFRTLAGVDYQAGEAITVLDLQKRALEQIEQKGDLDGNLAFNMGIQEMAVLARRKGEVLPYRRRERIKFIDKRAPVFADLPCNIVFDVRFFLLGTLILYGKTRIINSFSKGRKMKPKRQKKRKGRAKA